MNTATTGYLMTGYLIMIERGREIVAYVDSEMGEYYDPADAKLVPFASIPAALRETASVENRYNRDRRRRYATARVVPVGGD